MGEELTDAEIQSKLEGHVAAADNEARDLDWAWDTYHENLSELEGMASKGMSPKQIQERAIKMVRSASLRGSRAGGNVSEIDILAIGHAGVQQWKDSDNGGKKDIVLAYGIINPGPDGDGNAQPMGIAVFICDETRGVDIGNITEKFRTLNNLKGWFDVKPSDEVPGVYVCNSTDRTRVEETESEKSDADKREFLHQFVEDEASIADIHTHLSRTNEQGYAAEFGADVKRIVADIVDVHQADTFNTYTILDDSVVDPAELGADIVSDRARSPGLTCWVPDDFVQYAPDSQCEFYGTITVNQDGQVSMNVVGIHPLWPIDLEPEDTTPGGVPDSTTTSVI